jgi:hypothetical protein
MAMPRTADSEFDAAVVDREDHTFALIKAKALPEDRWATILPRQLAKFAQPVDFVFAIDPNFIRLYSSGGESLGEPIVQLDTRQILRHYDPKFPKERVFERYMVTLAEAWLRDLAYHWKSEDPPGSEELAGTGLLEKLEEGTTQPLRD